VAFIPVPSTCRFGMFQESDLPFGRVFTYGLVGTGVTVWSGWGTLAYSAPHHDSTTA
jgi:hypothetical protein